MEYENYTFGEALKHLADRAGVELPQIEYSKEVREKAQERAELLEINKQAAQYFYYQLRTEKGAQGYQYLTGRDSVRRRCVSSGLVIRTNSAVDCINSLSPRVTVMTGSGIRAF